MLMTAWNLASHLLPVIITVLVITGVYLAHKFHPYFHHIDLVARAGTDQGRENLARYLAHKAGGKKIHVDQMWPGFLAPAMLMYKQHITKKNS